MTNSTLHHDIAAPVTPSWIRPKVPLPASGDRLRHGPDAAARASEQPVGLVMETSPEPLAWPAEAAGRTPASQHEFYQYFGLALIAISVLVAARG